MNKLPRPHARSIVTPRVPLYSTVVVRLGANTSTIPSINPGIATLSTIRQFVYCSSCAHWGIVEYHTSQTPIIATVNPTLSWSENPAPHRPGHSSLWDQIGYNQPSLLCCRKCYQEPCPLSTAVLSNTLSHPSHAHAHTSMV